MYFEIVSKLIQNKIGYLKNSLMYEKLIIIITITKLYISFKFYYFYFYIIIYNIN